MKSESAPRFFCEYALPSFLYYRLNSLDFSGVHAMIDGNCACSLSCAFAVIRMALIGV